MWKWKPEHTVDLRVTNATLHARDYPFQAEVHGALPPEGELWEFKFESKGRRLVPVRRRDDKHHANAHKVCVEIQKAHEAALTVHDVIGMVLA